MCIDMSADMCIDMHGDRWIGTYVDMRIDMWIEMCIDMWIDKSIDMRVYMCACEFAESVHGRHACIGSEDQSMDGRIDGKTRSDHWSVHRGS